MIKLILDAVGVAGGSTFSAVSKSLVFTLGLTLLGEALALLVRSGAATGLLNSGSTDAPRRQQTASDGAANWLRRQVDQGVTTGSDTDTPTSHLIDDRRRDRHEHHHDHDHHHNTTG